MQSKILFIFFMLCTQLGYNQSILKGTVRNEEGIRLKDSKIYLMVKAKNNSFAIDAKSNKKTDSNGEFTLTYDSLLESFLYVEAPGILD